ncbi:UDP-N-acetyl-D-mannosamine dehydrogenase [Oerskovia sp. Root22]|uniref:UDP-N-acetyl-D-mannosamine dehydrogenase n=1 Tax=Oerskovia sp. Root22 TaxID=1736494 RepID=UPI0006FCB2D3|nr:UDP-N-acetyl-D-mannosamine dehydrogenase [Oerskovia sp. Root22]KRC42577.1 UDP-N-acetyl-D-mannosaminuronic acid dehydrogenase [Oerskovia sp. Root22]
MGISSVAVIGLGYIGLPTAAILASQDVTVLGVDISQRTVDAVNRGDVPFVEPDLATYVAGAVTQGKLSAALTPSPADAFIVAVPTPFTDGMKPDLSYIQAAAQAIAPQLQGGELLILESTSPPGATQRMADWILEARPDLSLDGSGDRPVIHVAHCPERVLPGRVMIELVTNDRIVGGLTAEAAERARDLYQVFCQGEILLTDAVTAEMAKLVENSFRDVNIAFANELSVISDNLGIDVWELIRLANHHPRVNILQPGPGVGGHCIAVDPWFIVDAAPEDARLIRTAREVNDAKPQWVIDKVGKAAKGVPNPTVAALGLAFKANIDDLRESPARKIVGQLADEMADATILVVEPHIEELPKELANRRNVELVSLEDALAQADVVVLLVDHDQFEANPPIGSRSVARIDTRGIWEPQRRGQSDAKIVL